MEFYSLNVAFEDSGRMSVEADGNGEGFIVKDPVVSTGRHDIEKSNMVIFLKLKLKGASQVGWNFKNTSWDFADQTL